MRRAFMLKFDQNTRLAIGLVTVYYNEGYEIWCGPDGWGYLHGVIDHFDKTVSGLS
jgi:hypothetical protein